MSPEQLANIQARADAATEGPWETMRAGLLGTRVVHVDGEWEGIVPAEFITMVTPALKKADDALFMAHARTDVPELLALVREQAAKLDELLALAHVADVNDQQFGDGNGGSLTTKAIRAALEPTHD